MPQRRIPTRTKLRNRRRTKAKANPDVRIDFEGLNQRILALPIPARNYVSLLAGKEGQIFLNEAPAVFNEDGPPPVDRPQFDLKSAQDRESDGERRAQTVLCGQRRESCLCRAGDDWKLISRRVNRRSHRSRLKLAEMEVWVDPRLEWKQMYREAWRHRSATSSTTRHATGSTWRRPRSYAPYRRRIAQPRATSTTSSTRCSATCPRSHLHRRRRLARSQTDRRSACSAPTTRVENGRYRFARIYNGENWNPQLRAPLTQPGVNVKAGEYLLAVNGRDLRATDNVYRLLRERRPARSVTLKVGPNADGANARDVTVVPVESETALRNLAWIEDNRRKVDQLTGGQRGLRLPARHRRPAATRISTATSSPRSTRRRRPRRALQRRRLAGRLHHRLPQPAAHELLVATRDGEDFDDSPAARSYGPKAMIVNEFAGSGGDAMPWYFRQAKVGPLVGKRTWGGLVGICGYPPLIDGGSVTAPSFASTDPTARGTSRTTASRRTSKSNTIRRVRQGRDPQLEKAVDVILEQLKKTPRPVYKRPDYPKYPQVLPKQ